MYLYVITLARSTLVVEVVVNTNAGKLINNNTEVVDSNSRST